MARSSSNKPKPESVEELPQSVKMPEGFMKKVNQAAREAEEENAERGSRE